MRTRWISRAVLAGTVVGFVIGAATPTVHADQIADKRKQARRIALQLNDLEAKAETLAEVYNNANVALAQLNVDVKQAQARLANYQVEATKVTKRMGAWAVQAYVNANQGDPVFAVIGGDATGNSYEAYSAIAVGQDSNLSGELRQRQEDVNISQADLANKLLLQKSLKADLGNRKKAAETAVRNQQTLLATTKSDLGQLVVEEQQRVAAAEQKKVEQQIAARNAARAAGVQPTSSSSPGPEHVNHTPPPPSPGASGAISQARSQLGVPYHWGQIDPGNGFDCSGLTSWAWGQAGRSLPHSSMAQWDMFTPVDIQDIQPGDLVFFGSDVHHVGLYIGNGEMIDAPHSGAVVRIATIFRRDLRGARRV